MAGASSSGQSHDSTRGIGNIVPSWAKTNAPHIPVIARRERRLKRSVRRLLRRLGLGLCDPVPYDTAWVARIPLQDDLDRPAFPLSLEWLRDHQRDDGSWSSAPPFCPQSSTLNTLAAVLALKQWNNPDDEHHIQRGVGALWHFADQLSDELHPMVGFELTLAVLQEVARQFDLDIPYAQYEIHVQKIRGPLERRRASFKEEGYNESPSWWQTVELLGNDSDLNMNDREMKFASSMLLTSGSAGASPSATAYLLRSERLRGRDIAKAYEYLEEMYVFREGGISKVYPIDIFELAFGIDFFLKAGFSAKDPMFAASIRFLSVLSEGRTPEETTGLCSHLKVSDTDTMAVASYVLHEAGYKVSVGNLLKFFKDDHFVRHVTERKVSVSTNIDALQCLRLFQEHEGVIDVVEKVAHFLESKASHETQVLVKDKWHRSPYYTTSRAVFSFHGLRDNLVGKLVEYFVKNQNSDGGWGEDGFSTAEESAYVILALCFARKNGYSFPDAILSSASEFLFGTNSRPNAELWVGRVLYRPTLVSESAVLAAKYAVMRTVEQSAVRTILMESRAHYVTTTYSCDRVAYEAELLSFTTGFDTAPYSDRIDRAKKLTAERLMSLQLVTKRYPGTTSLDFFIHCAGKFATDENLKLCSFLTNANRICDCILFSNMDKYTNNVAMVQQVILTFLKILHGDIDNVDDVLQLDFPKFKALCELYFDVRQELISKSNDIHEVLNEVKKLFFLPRISPQSSKEYLEIWHKRATTLGLMSSISNMFHGLNVSSFENCKDFLDIKFYGSRAACIASDIFAIRDDRERHFKNYVLLTRDELDGSMEDALRSSVKLYNRFMVRMLSAKNNIRNDPDYKDNKDLFEAIRIIECLVDGIRDSAAKAVRGRGVSPRTESVRLSGIKQLTEADLNRIVDDEERANFY